MEDQEANSITKADAESFRELLPELVKSMTPSTLNLFGGQMYESISQSVGKQCAFKYISSSNEFYQRVFALDRELSS
jgi:hypothetical protein